MNKDTNNNNIIDINKKPPKKGKNNWVKIRVEYESSSKTLEEVAKNNGVSHDRIRAIASKEKWSKNRENIQQRLYEEMINQAIKENTITAEYILEKLKAIVEDAEMKPANKLKALELLGKSIGLFKETVNMNANISETKKLEDIILENEL